MPFCRKNYLCTLVLYSVQLDFCKGNVIRIQRKRGSRLVGEAIFERKKRPWPWKFPSPVLSFTWCEKMFLLLYLFFINVALLVSEATPLYSFLGDLGGNNSLFGHLLVKSSREVIGRCERVESLKFLVIANVSFELKNQSYASGFMEPFKEELCNLELSQECHLSAMVLLVVCAKPASRKILEP